jgi:hypothetical protein
MNFTKVYLYYESFITAVNTKIIYGTFIERKPVEIM